MHIKTKKILITTERHEILIVRQISGHTIPGFCPTCNEKVEMINFDDAVSQSGVGGREMLNRSEDGEIHSVASATGHLLICKRSLAAGMVK